jgi:hypothetical protein
MSSSSTGVPRGRLATPYTSRDGFLSFPKTSCSSSEAPSATFGCSRTSPEVATDAASLTIRVTETQQPSPHEQPQPAPEAVTEPRHWLRRDQAFATMLGPRLNRMGHSVPSSNHTRHNDIRDKDLKRVSHILDALKQSIGLSQDPMAQRPVLE